MFVLLPLAACKRGTPPGATTATSAPATKPAPLPPLPKPTGPLAATASCVTAQCHATYQTAAFVHGPVSQGACNACHEADQGEHHYPLKRKGNAMCTFCHGVSGSKAHQHKAVDQFSPTTQPASATESVKASGGCLNCHDPHISRAKYMLAADNVEHVCAKCHSLPLKKHAHEPFALGQCTVCHQSHESDYAKLLRNGDGPEHCFSCHTEKRLAMKQPHVHKASQQSCVTCHGPHATDNAKQLKQPVNDTCLSCHFPVKAEIAKAKQVHGAITQGNCASCHDPHASQQPNELKDRADRLCLTCHEKAINVAATADKPAKTVHAMGAVLASANLHGPVKSGNCSECHKAHAADQPNLLKFYFPDSFYTQFDVKKYDLCFSCHDKTLVLKDKTANLTNFRDGERNLHFVHVNKPDKGRTCKTCHEVHGSNLPRHMSSAVPFEGSSWAMPIHYEASGTGGSCTPACHAEKTYNRTTPVNRGQP